MAAAKYWITNSRLPLWLPKSKNTLCIQTWHGTPLKKYLMIWYICQIPQQTSINRIFKGS
ncbi:CDP-glycerol glycerophosphotransferase family protein [Bacillus atrophaeus]|uniref:CDP-glycerol glycerophosphotransferase family protein n=1 Tax=Bacillus atrophaeus TaxID=1452 RepID=UPI002281E51F|nr:CDP-glycerol glycerophosphotransferase family protein [Bacillus atrophaeus]MEC0805969.1 CDP-glycerol glycerophosphotransferase family protein [Bacillus atrophaeus]MEC0854042.1 CDP-glycerol glycerophosphotransferase family protein [Bacillus atrophaeus]MEC0856983.1 CDP-glycerol glycerophosphotransferase family protein [Bacillus atrophaeus]MEC0861134.1 CDP-glycerol glycerophosphotransferase family protein [Bacillus atrophaeus]MEC0871365.1 CDP-glycerol glycerophosphotransferase family protein [